MSVFYVVFGIFLGFLLIGVLPFFLLRALDGEEDALGVVAGDAESVPSGTRERTDQGSNGGDGVVDGER